MPTMPLSHRRYPIAKLLILGLVFHLVYIWTVFDCYFTSPVVHGMKRYGSRDIEAKRLVLIVGDGLRADLLLSQKPFPMIPDSPEIVAPYLRSIVETRGAFGVSHTRVPTESRPGHVALIGGMYEDVSAVTRGWKTNPVSFDSVFNQSSHTYSFGSPDILPMFAHGATPGKVDMWCYHEDKEDFTKDATALDIWVLDHLRALFHNATGNETLNVDLHRDKTVFFLHLLGLDTTGHSYRPHSKEYMANIQVVDTIVKQTEALFTEFYRDEATSFVFTADHGMSKIGNHGDGDPDNTRTPLIVWGAGVREPLPDSVPSSHDEYSEPWGLPHLLRRDVEQADVAALMSALLGIDWPANSVGVLPDVDHTEPGYLAASVEEQAQLALVNAQVILEQYRVKHELKKERSLFYKPFGYFAQLEDFEDTPGLSRLQVISRLINAQRPNEARETAAELIRHALAGIRYLETYDRFLIRAIVISAYLGWIAYSAVHVMAARGLQSLQNTFLLDVVAILTLTAFWCSFAFQHSPATLYLYVIFPIYFWREAIVRSGGSIASLVWTNAIPVPRFWEVSCRALLVVAALLSMVAGYTHRSIWSVILVIIGVLWPTWSWPSGLLSKNLVLFASWALLCLATAAFPLLPVHKEENITEIMAGGAGMIAAGVVGALSKTTASSQHKRRMATLLGVQCTLTLLSMFVTASSASSLKAKLGLPFVNQVAGWAILVVASAVPFVIQIPSQPPIIKILTMFMGFSVCFVILSISVEGLFFLAYSATLVVWVEVEVALRSYARKLKSKTEGYRVEADDVRVALFFLFFVQLAFFGTGNVASISSFYLEPVYRLVPIFNPFLMAALLMFKIVAPYAMLSVCFAFMNARLHLPPLSLFMVALTLTDVMTMTFFLNVTDTGSWLEIGQTISFFCISSLLLVWSAGICAIGEILMADALAPMSRRAPKTS